MKINYRLEIRYFGIDENGNKIDRYDNFIFENENSFENRKKVFENYQNYFDIFNDALKYGKLKLSWEDIINKNIKEYHIPTMNIYYSTKEFNGDKEDIVLFGELLETFEERIDELKDELKFYEVNSIPYEHETIVDINDNYHKVIKGSLINENDNDIIKNVC